MTKRRRNDGQTFTQEVLDAFNQMEKARKRGDDDAWWDAHSVLHGALRLPPWQYPAFEYPDDPCPYRHGSPAAAHWHRERTSERLELYHGLKQASA